MIGRAWPMRGRLGAGDMPFRNRHGAERAEGGRSVLWELADKAARGFRLPWNVPHVYEYPHALVEAGGGAMPWMT